MKIIKELSIAKPIKEVWNILGNEFGEIDKWSSLIDYSEMSGPSIGGGDHSIRTTKTKKGTQQQQLTSFDSQSHVIAYKSLSGAPPIIKQVNAIWSLTEEGTGSTRLVLDFQAEMKGLGHIIAPIAKMKLGKVGDVLLDDFKYYVENGKAHPRKIAAK